MSDSKYDDKFQEVMTILENLHWFENLPKEFCGKVQETIRHNIQKFQKDETTAFEERSFYDFLTSVYIDMDLTDFEGEFIDVVEEFGKGSLGLFHPVDLEEEWEEKIAYLAFKSLDEPYYAEVDDEEGDIEEIIEAVNSAMGDLEPPMYFEISKAGFFPVSLETRGRAIDSGFLPYHLKLSDGDSGKFPTLHWEIIYPSGGKTPQEVVEETEDLIETDKRLGGSALHWAARLGNKEFVSLLIKAGADINQQSSIVKDQLVNSLTQATPLHWATLSGHTDIVKALVDAGANIGIKNRLNETVKHLAICENKKDIIELLNT